MSVRQTPTHLHILIGDNGDGVFNQLAKKADLPDAQRAALEIAKGRLTTQPECHGGRGLFFVARMVDAMNLQSNGQVLQWRHRGESVQFRSHPLNRTGTTVFVSLSLDSTVRPTDTYSAFGSEDAPLDFSRTQVPLRLLTDNGLTLDSRAQARWVVSRLELFAHGRTRLRRRRRRRPELHRRGLPRLRQGASGSGAAADQGQRARREAAQGRNPLSVARRVADGLPGIARQAVSPSRRPMKGDGRNRGSRQECGLRIPSASRAVLMIPSLRRALSAASLPLLATAAGAATLPVPPDFGIVERHEAVTASWSLMRGESPSVVDRDAIEQLCAAKRSIGATGSTPVFEAGTGQPNTVEIIHIVAASAWASYETLSGTVCDPASMDAAKDLCSCTFRSKTSRFMHIRKASGAGTDVIDARITDATATRRLSRGTFFHPPSAMADPASFGPVVGHDVVAGRPCSIHRRDLATLRTELCLSDPTDDTPLGLRYQELASTTFRLEPAGPSRRDWRRAERIEPEGEIDAGVFDLPAGVAVR